MGGEWAAIASQFIYSSCYDMTRTQTWIAAKVVATVEFNHGPIATQLKIRRFISYQEYNPSIVTQSGCLANPHLDQGLRLGSNPDHSWVTLNRC